MNHYEILEVSEFATREEIKKAYKRLAKQYHPDKNPDKKGASDHMQKLNEAHEILADEAKRAAFDHTLKHSNSRKSNFYQPEAKYRESRGRDTGDGNASYKKAYEEKTNETDRHMKDREQQIKSDEESLKNQQEKFKNTRRRFWVVVAIIAVAVCVLPLQFVRNESVLYRDLVARNDSLSFELKAREFLINEGLNKNSLEKVRSFVRAYELSANGVNTYSSIETFKRDMRDEQKAKEYYDNLLKANVSINMNFEQFYKTVKFD